MFKRPILAFSIDHSAVAALALAFILTNVALADKPESPIGVPTRLVIPSIALDREVFPVGWTQINVGGVIVDRWDTLDNDVAWHDTSAKLGQVGNTVLNGHSNVYGRVFRDLTNVEVGDEIIAFSGEQAYHYVVVEKILVREKGVSHEQHVENARFILPTDDERLTLVTCAGRGAADRLIVIAQPAGKAIQR
jgi:LPXTG-site transpeptidase (sortase) family protein